MRVPWSAENDKNVHGDEPGEALCVGLLQFSLLWKNLCASLIVMMEPAQDRVGEDLPTCGIWWQWLSWWYRDLLLDPLMRPGSVEVHHICVEHALELLLLQDEQVIETLSTYATQKPFTDGIGPWGVVGGFQDLDAAGCGHARETGSKFVITIANEILRPLSIGGCLSQLLCGPSISRRASDHHMNDSA